MKNKFHGGHPSMFGVNERQQLLVDIARMYYFENLSQQQIADTLHMSRSNVSLLLKECLEKKIIEIQINDVVSRAHELAAKIKQRYGLQTVLIARSCHNPEQTVASVARLAAHYLRGIVGNNMLIGYTNDTMMRILSDVLYFPEYIKINSIQMLGGTFSTYHDEDGQFLAREFQKKCNGTAYVLQAPQMVKSTMLKQALLEEPVIKDIFYRFGDIDIALTTIEKRVPLYGLPSDDFLSSTDSMQLSELGAICHFCGHYLDRDGKPCSASINDRVIAISLQQFRKIPIRVGLAANANNAPAVLSCMQGRYINVLIVDEALAKNLI